MADHPLQGREVIFEFQSIGQYVKITAMDTATMTEVVIQGPATASEAILKANAAKKLEYMLRKKGLI
jgi:hypothetical protein